EGDAVPARRIARWKGRDVWEARVTFQRPPAKLKYGFRLEDGGASVRFPEGKARFTLAAAQAGRFETPDWVRDAVFYQIFPDRFRDGDPNTQPAAPPRPEGKPWGIDDRYLDRWGTAPAHFNFMGGDLAGITEKADYIASLGATCVYLNPIFKAGSNHRYDAADYEQVDPGLGTLDDL
ncbi:MAG: hypothetical protein KDA27_29120, partial [Candidatus Eisenbacteria bacterium]|nr:hypothetical protein [Candidatus Eisenbacteria bacterium]